MNAGLLINGVWRTVRPPKKADDERQDMHEWHIGMSALLWLMILVEIMRLLWTTGAITVITLGLIVPNPYVQATELEEAKQAIIDSSVARSEERTKQIDVLTADTKANGLGLLEMRIDGLHQRQCLADDLNNQTAVVAIGELLRTKQTEYAGKAHGQEFELLPCL